MSASKSAIEAAAAHDNAGEHDEAVNVLARATRAGDLDAMTTLGKRLVVGDRAPYLPKEGAGMVLEAAQKGVAEAVSQVAVFQCTGVFQQKSWPHALATLTHAAVLGWRPAREQLMLLGGASLEGLDPVLANEDAGCWLKAAEAIDLAPWFRAGDNLVVNESPLVRRFSNFLPAEVCKLLIRQSSQRLQPALVYDPGSKRNIRFKTRTNSIAQFNLVENDFIHFLLQEKMSAACGQPMQHMEATAILNYKPGEEITNHYDFVDPELPNYEEEIAENGQRVITFLIYLNDDYEGGETCFPKLGVNHKGCRGEGLYFMNSLPDGSSDVRTLHAGRPPVSGQKWIVSQFIRNRPVKYVL